MIGEFNSIVELISKIKSMFHNKNEKDNLNKVYKLILELSGDLCINNIVDTSKLNYNYVYDILIDLEDKKIIHSIEANGFKKFELMRILDKERLKGLIN